MRRRGVPDGGIISHLSVEEAGGSYVELKASSSDDGEPLSNVVFGRPGLVERIAATLAG